MQLVRTLKKVSVWTLCCLALATTTGVCQAEEAASPWMVRVRALGIFPDESSSTLMLGNTPISGSVEVDNAITPELDISYFFTSNVSAELVLAYARHDVSVKNTPLGSLDLGSLDLLPPTLTLQYHFMTDKAFRPYIGAGASYVLIPNEDRGQALSVDYDDGKVGFALQAGFDYFFTKNWCLNVDVKKVWVNVDATVQVVPGGYVHTKVDVDPLLVGVGIGYRF